MILLVLLVMMPKVLGLLLLGIILIVNHDADGIAPSTDPGNNYYDAVSTYYVCWGGWFDCCSWE